LTRLFSSIGKNSAALRNSTPSKRANQLVAKLMRANRAGEVSA
jgi:demethoxyubiquinone hydroxylase (CLK1/Coq7/Cat5 family)